ELVALPRPGARHPPPNGRAPAAETLSAPRDQRPRHRSACEEAGAGSRPRDRKGGSTPRGGAHIILLAAAGPPLDLLPIDVREEGVDVLPPLRRPVVDHEGVLPDVHDQERPEASRVSVLVQRDPVIAQAP